MPDVPLYREGLALGWIDVGQLLHETGRDAEAEKVLRQAMPHFEWLVGRYPDVLGYVEGRAAASDVLGQILGDLGRRDDALKMLAAAVDGFHEVRELVPDSVAYRERYAVCCSHRAQLYHKSGDSARAEEDFHTAAGLLEDLGRNAPNEVSYRSGLAFVCEHRGRWSRSADKKAEAEADFRRARDIREGLVRDGAPPNEVYLLAWFYANCAEPALRDPARACELARTACDRNPQNAWYHLALAAGHYRSADCAAAETALREAQRLRSDAAAPFWFYAAMIEHRLGRAERAAESYGRGCQWLKDNSPDRQEWCALRDEAAGVLGMKPSK
jgi:tetratricopeptide (TPR) repeat protein